MIRWESDTCLSCVWDMEARGEEWIGVPVTPCPFHKTLDEALHTNRFKNSTITTICEALNMDPLQISDPDLSKNITFTILESGGLIFNLKNFTQEEISIINGLNIVTLNGLGLSLNITMTE